MIDIDMTMAVLRVLTLHSGAGPVTEELIGLGYQARTHKPPYAGRIRAALDECKRQRWAEETADEWGRPVWIATAAGIDRDKQP